MGCSPSKHKKKDNAWEENETTFSNPSIKSASKQSSATSVDKPTLTNKPPPIDVTTPIPHKNNSSKLSGLKVDTSNSPLSVSNTPSKKLTLLQARSMNSVLSVQTSNSESNSDFSSLPVTPSLDVVVPDDFRKKYKMLSVMSEKSIDSFAFHGTEFVEEDGVVSVDDDFDDDDRTAQMSDSAVVVYKGIDRQKKYVIVERTRVDCFKKSSIQIEYFDRIDLLRRINHVCIPSILDVFDTPTDYTIVLQYGVGKSLAELMETRGGMSNKESVKALILALVETLRYLHKMNIAHRNISAEHLIVSRFNHFGRTKELRVTGLGRLQHIVPPDAPTSLPVTPTVAARKDASGTIIAVPAVPEKYLNVFCAPEIALPNHTLAVDLYSLGVVIYSLVNGAVPADKASMNVTGLVASSKLKHLIKSLTHEDPSARYNLSKVEKYFVKTYLSDNDEANINKQNAESSSSSLMYDSRSSSLSDYEDDEDDMKSRVSNSSTSSAVSSTSVLSGSSPIDKQKRELERNRQQEVSRKMLELLEGDLSPC